MTGRLLRRARRTREPTGVPLFLREAGSALSAPFTSLNHWLRLRRLGHSSVDKPRRWQGRPWMRFVTWFTWLLALIFLLWLARSAFVIVRGRPVRFLVDPDNLCSKGDIATSCGAISGFVNSLLFIALASAVFLLWRLQRVRYRYRAKARQRPAELVPTAGSILGKNKIVGRDELCQVLMEDLRDRGDTRRPRLLIGGVGTGKTAVVVKLTELLARCGAVPVPIRLREAEDLNFEDLAKKQFLNEINEQLASESEGERIWRRLLRDGQIVVLADGLEEAFLKTKDRDKDQDRDNRVRIAIRTARQQHLPLFIASRPHNPLRGMDAAIYELEPLSEDAAQSYVAEGSLPEDERRLSWIAETADVAEAPLYMQIIRDIYRCDMLDDIPASEDELLGTRSHDRSTLRLHLMETWEAALVGGYLHPEVPLSREERKVTLEWLSALACVGLKSDSLDVRFDQVPGKIRDEVDRRSRVIERGMQHELGLTGIDEKLAVTWGFQLGLVEPLPRGARFQHSLIQAYLGSRLMDAAFCDARYVEEALGRAQSGVADLDRAPRPGREFLIALVLNSRRAKPEPAEAEEQAPRRLNPANVCATLANAADKRTDTKPLDIYAAALEIGSVAPDPGSRRETGPFAETISHVSLASKVKMDWPEMHSGDRRTLEEGKFGLVHRFGQALRMLDERRRRHDYTGLSGYAQLYDICCAETNYPVRVAAAREIGLGGAEAYSELEGKLAVPRECRMCQQERGRRAEEAEEKLDAGGRWRARLGGSRAEEAEEKLDAGGRWRARLVSARLAPLLISSVETPSNQPRQALLYTNLKRDLDQWLRHLVPGGDQHPAAELTISEEIALAQGFKHAANHHHGRVHYRPEASTHLAEKALEMLKNARYWFSQLTLIQALCLWAMPEGNDSSTDSRRANPDEIVEHWLEVAGSERPEREEPDGHRTRPNHPFVAAAADLVSHALETGHPERFIWMDESEVVAGVGASQQVAKATERKHHQWIRPSMGWSGLDPRAQQLVADVLLLLNLAERGEEKDLEQRLHRADRDDLPPCVTRDRRPLEPERTVGTAATHQPGTSCYGGCRFELCPYPPKGLQPHRAELSEAFCKHQYTLLRGAAIQPRRARWQGMRSARLRTFWSQMADRARIGPADS